MMADKNMVSLISELERRYLECSICTEVFDEDERTPRLLPCHHSFCSECIKRLGRRKDTLKCPSCNAVHKVLKNSPKDFPKDNTRRDLTSFLQTHSYRNAFKKCCECGRTVDVTHTCQQCKMDFCEMCRLQHITENKSHSLIVNNSETFQEKEDNFDICQIPNHERAKLKYFCNSANCQSVLCPSCALEDHREISKHALEDIEEAFKKRKKDLCIDVESIRTQILHIKSKLQKVHKITGTLQEETDKLQRNVYPIYDRNIKSLLDQYDIGFQRIESKLVVRKDYLSRLLKNASECCSLSEQLINCNSVSSFLNVHPTVDGQLQLYLNTQVDSTEGEIDLELKMFVDDSLRLLERSVNSQKNHEGDEVNSYQRHQDEILLVNQGIGNHQDIHLKNTTNAFGKNIYNTVAASTIYFIIKMIRIILNLPIKVIIKIAVMPVQLIINIYREYLNNLPLNRVQPVDWQIVQANQIERQLRNRRRIERVYNRRHHGDGRYRRDNNLEYCRDVQTTVVWPILLLLIWFLVIPEIALIPLDIREHGKLRELKFDTQVGSQFTCRSADYQTVATVPSENMLCGSGRRLFKFLGGFANSSFPPKKERSIEFSIRFHELYLQKKKYGEVLIFEFGLTKDSISTKLLFPSILSVRAFACQHKSDIYLLIGNTVLINSTDIIKCETRPYCFDARFMLTYRPFDSSVLFLSKSQKNNATTILHTVKNVNFIRPLKPVFAVYNSDLITVSITIETNKVVFDRNTLHQDLYISDNSRKMSNAKLSDTFPSNSSRTPVIYTRPKKFINSNAIQTKIDILFETNDGDIFFKIGIVQQKDGFPKVTPLLQCSKYVETRGSLYSTTCSCLSNTYKHKIFIGNQLSLFLHYNKNGIIEMYIPDYFLGYSYLSFQFEPFNKLAPKFFIEKINAKDIIVSSIKHTELINVKRIIFVLILGVALLLLTG